MCNKANCSNFSRELNDCSIPIGLSQSGTCSIVQILREKSYNFATNHYLGKIKDRIKLAYGHWKYIGELFWKDSEKKYCDFHCCAPDIQTLILKIDNDMFVDYKEVNK